MPKLRFEPPTPVDKAIRLPRVCELLGVSRATIWRWVKLDPSFPKPFSISAGITCWSEVEVVLGLESKMTTARYG